MALSLAIKAGRTTRIGGAVSDVQSDWSVASIPLLTLQLETRDANEPELARAIQPAVHFRFIRALPCFGANVTA